MKVIKIERKEQQLELGSLPVTLTQQPPVGEMCRETQWFSESEWLWPITGGGREEQGKDGKKGGEWLETVWEDRERRGLESMNLCVIWLQEALKENSEVNVRRSGSASAERNFSFLPLIGSHSWSPSLSSDLSC